MSIEARDFEAVIPEVDVIHLIPIEVRNELQFRFPQLNKVHRIIPIAGRCPRSWILNQDWCSVHNRRLYLKKRDGIHEKVAQRPLSIQFCQNEFLEQEFL